MSTVHQTATIAWPKLPRTIPTTNWYRASIALDDAGSFALVRYLDVQRSLCTGLLWDLSKGAAVPGQHIDLHPNGRRAIRRAAKGSEIVDLESGRVVAKIEDHLDMALSPDAAFAVQRPRGDAIKKAVRSTMRVHASEGGKGGNAGKELPTRSILEAFVAGGRLATVSERGAVTLWDLATGKEVGKLPGLAKPASIRVAPSGTRIALSAYDGQYAVYDLDSPKPVAKGKTTIIFGDDAWFDGTRWVGTHILFDIETRNAKSHAKGWLKGPRHGGRDQTVVIEHPTVGVVTQRELLGNPVVELWDVDAEKKLAFAEVQPRAYALAFAANTIAVAHLPADDEEWPAVTILTLSGTKRGGAKPASTTSRPSKTSTATKKTAARRTTVPAKAKS